MRFGWAAGAVLVAAGTGRGQHVDVQMQVTAGKLQTGRIDFTQPGSPIDPTWRVFEAAFGEVPNFTDDPGFNAAASGGLPANTLIEFNILDAVRKWNSATGTFELAAAGAITVSFAGAISVASPGGCNEFREGFAFAQTSGTGSVHQHVQYLLNGGAADGVYLLKLEVALETPGIQKSDPFWIVFSQNVPAGTAVAAAYVRSLLVAPACAGDVNRDGFVNGADLSVLLGGFGSCVMNGSSADFNADGLINGADLSVLLSNFGTGC